MLVVAVLRRFTSYNTQYICKRAPDTVTLSCYSNSGISCVNNPVTDLKLKHLDEEAGTEHPAN